MTPTLTQLIYRLQNVEVDFCVVIGMAMATTAPLSHTPELDICIALDYQNLQRLKDAVSVFGAYHRLHPGRIPFNEDGEALAAYKNLYLRTELGDLNCLGQIQGIGGYPEALKHCLSVQMNDRPCYLLSHNGLQRVLTAMHKNKKSLNAGGPRIIRG